jgi:predicted NBD/HSP70 family sugar kinase
MRRLNPARFHVATRGTTREINRSIVLNLVRAHQPISRADLARVMGVRRGVVSLIVSDLLRHRLVFEETRFEAATATAPTRVTSGPAAIGPAGDSVRGRKPTWLYIDSRRRAVIAVDIRVSATYVMLADLLGQPLTEVVSFATARDPRRLVSALARRITGILAEHRRIGACEGIGVVVPGMVEHSTMKVLHAPTLGWRNVTLREPLSAATGLPVQIENSGRACALAQMWVMRGAGSGASASATSATSGSSGDLAFVSVSDGVGVGVIIQGDVLRGRHNIAGEFGHVPLSLDGPRCSCGSTGCWEAYISNRTTLARYANESTGSEQPPTVVDLVARAHAGDAKAIAAVQETARYLGLGLASVVNVMDPACVYIGGEIALAWDLIEATVRAGLASRALTPAAAATELRPVPATEFPRLQGAAALVAAPAFAAPIVA